MFRKEKNKPKPKPRAKNLLVVAALAEELNYKIEWVNESWIQISLSDNTYCGHFRADTSCGFTGLVTKAHRLKLIEALE